MNIRTFKASLLAQPEKNLRFVLPDGDLIPVAFHVTEVGHVVKNFIDCGGTVRRVESCLLQAWVSDEDPDHRLAAGKLAHILELSRPLLPSEDLDVEVEYECCAVSQYKIDAVSASADALTFTLVNKETACLARESCGLEPAAGSGCGCGPGTASGKCC
jgi:hypothetical protein